MSGNLSADVVGKIPRSLYYKLLGLEGDQQATSIDVTNIQSSIGVMQAQITALQSSVSALQAALAALEDDIPNYISTSLDATISGGVITLTETDAAEYRVTVISETGTTDQLDRINGLSAGKKVVLFAEDEHEITVKNGAYLKLQWDFILDGYKSMALRSWGDSICAEESRADIYDTEAQWGALDDWLAAVSDGHYCDPASTMAERCMYFASDGLVGSLS